MQEKSSSPRIVRFGAFELDLRAGELHKNGLKIKLQEQPFEVLVMLLRHPGEVVTREELQKTVWPADTFVDFDRGLNKTINKIREALGDSADNPRFVETLPRRGYRFIAAVDVGAVRKPPLGIRRWVVASVGVVVVAVSILAYVLGRPLPPPRVLRFAQITHDAQAKTWFPCGSWVVGSWLATDGSRVYFVEGDSLAQVSAAGGETVQMEPLLRDTDTALFGISPDRSDLLIAGSRTRSPSNKRGVGGESALWILPVLGGTPRRVGDVLAHDATWFPGGQKMLYANGHSLYSVRRDGAESLNFATTAGLAWWPRWSPEGSSLRFTLYDPSGNSTSLWELSADGKDLHPWLSGWNSPPQECCGNWTPDGKYFVFQSTRDGRTDIWARREKGEFLRKASREPIRLTAGPIETFAPVPSPDGKRLYVVGVQRHGELVRYESRSGGFMPYLSGISAEHLDFSRDGRWVTYVAYPEATLWRSKVDGTERLQLTSSPMRAAEPVWSPDGKWIAFMGSEPGRPWKICLVSAEGGTPQRLMPGERNEGNPGWSPDGTRLVFGRLPWMEGGTAGAAAIHVLDLKTKEVSTLPGSEGLMSPRWSPDGRYVAAVTSGQNWTQVLFDFTVLKWTEMTKIDGCFNRWSRDGKYLYFESLDSRFDIFRVRVSDRHLEEILAPQNVRRALGVEGAWVGLALDDSVLITRDVGIQEIMRWTGKRHNLPCRHQLYQKFAKLMAALQGAGLSRRRSRRALQAVLRAWKEALERNEPVEVGVGWLVLARVRQRRRLRLKKIVDVPRYPLTGVLLPSRRSPLPPRDRAYRTVVCSLATHPSKRSLHRPLHTLPKTPGQLRTRPRTVANGLESWLPIDVPQLL